MKKRFVEILASAVQARLNCIKSGNTEWRDKHEDRIGKLVDRYMPSGSGFDNGTKIDFDRSSGEKLVFYTSFHHMTEGMYNGWTEHTLTVVPSFMGGFSLKISGRDRNGIKEYIGDCVANILGDEMEEFADEQQTT
jgi:hypothetical protein